MSAFIVLRLAVLFAFLGFVLWLVSRKLRTHSELMHLHLMGRNRLLDRFQDPEQLLTFARTEEGHALLEAPHLERPQRPRPGLRLLQASLFCLPVGGGLILAGERWLRLANPNRGNFLDTAAVMDAREYLFLGQMILAVGIGLLLAGLLAWRLDRRA